MSEYWGYHAQFNCGGCDKTLITDKKNILKFTKVLIDRIGMKQYGKTICEHFATHDPSKAGYSMLALIETSNLAGHFVDESGEAFIDVFSCLDYDIEIVKTTIEEFFKPERMNYKKDNRRA